MNFWEANQPFVVSACIIALGYVLKRLKVLDVSHGEVLAKIIFNVTLPALILLNVPAVPLTGANVILPFCAPVQSVLMVLLGLFFFRHQEEPFKGLSLASSSGYNVSLFAIPIATGLYGADGIARLALIDVGNALAVFGLSYYLAWRYSPHRGDEHPGLLGTLKMLFTSIPFVTYIVALIMNVTGLRLDGFIEEVVKVPATMNRGTALLTLGILLRFRFPREAWKGIIQPLLLRFGFGVVVAALVLVFAPIPLEVRLAIATILVTPVGLTIIPFSVKWGHDRDRAAAILNMAIPVSFLLFWAVYLAGRYLAT